MKVQVSGEGGYIVSASRREFPGSKSHWPNDLTLGVVRKDGSIDVWPAPYGTETRGSKPPPGWHATAERLLNSPAARRAILAGLKAYRKEMRSGTWGFLVKLSDGRKNVFSTVGQAMAWGEQKLRKMPNLSAYGLFHQDPKSPYHSVPFEALVKNEYGVMRRDNARAWEEILAAAKTRKHESGGNPRTSRRPARSQEEHFTHAHAKSAGADETMLNLLYGPNPITDDELRKLIAKRPHVYGKYAVYLGKRGQGAKHESGGNPRTTRSPLKLAHERGFESAILAQEKVREKYNRLVRESEAKYGSHGPLVSGVVREHFPAGVKARLRALVNDMNALGGAALTHHRGTGRRRHYSTLKDQVLKDRVNALVGKKS